MIQLIHLPLLIAHISASSVTLPLTIVLVTWKSRTKEIKLLFYLLVASLSSDLMGLLLFKLSLNSYPILNFFLLIQFLICFRILVGEKANMVAFRLVIIGFLLIFLANIFFIQGPTVFNSYSNSAACLILMFVSIRYFFTLLRDLPEENVMLIPLFWIAIGVLTYYSGNLLLFIVNNYLTLGMEGSHGIMWILHNLMNITKNIFFSIAIWQNYRKRRLFIF